MSTEKRKRNPNKMQKTFRTPSALPPGNHAAPCRSSTRAHAASIALQASIHAASKATRSTNVQTTSAQEHLNESEGHRQNPSQRASEGRFSLTLTHRRCLIIRKRRKRRRSNARCETHDVMTCWSVLFVASVSTRGDWIGRRVPVACSADNHLHLNTGGGHAGI